MIDKLRENLDQDKNNEDIRAQLAYLLEMEDDFDQAFEVLTENSINLTPHERSRFPCLCKKCISPSLVIAEIEGNKFYRDFALAQGRVLFFWVIDDVERHPRISRAVSRRLSPRLKLKKAL